MFYSRESRTSDAPVPWSQTLVTGLGLIFALVTLIWLYHREEVRISTRHMWPGLLLPVAYAAWFLTLHIRRRRHEAWCMRITHRLLIGYDQSRRRVEIRWPDVARVDVTPNGLTITGRKEERILLPRRYLRFSTLSHRIMRMAERYQIPVFIDGHKLDDIDVYRLYPFLRPLVSRR